MVEAGWRKGSEHGLGAETVNQSNRFRVSPLQLRGVIALHKVWLAITERIKVVTRNHAVSSLKDFEDGPIFI